MQSSSLTSASVFVTALGWVLVCFTVLGVFTSLMHTVFVNALLPALIQQGMTSHHIPAHRVDVARSITVLMLIGSVFLLYAASAFLQRRAWARQAFVIVFALGALWSAFVFFTMGLGVGVFHVLPPEAARHGVAPNVSLVLRVMAGLLGLLAAGVGIVLGWLVRCLSSPAIRSEFVHTASV